MSSLTIGRKLTVGVGSLVVVSFIFGATSLLGIASLGNRISSIVGKTVLKQTLAYDISTDASDLLGESHGVIVRGYMKDLPAADVYDRQFNTTLGNLQASIDTLRPMVFVPAAKQAIQEIQATIGPMRDASDSIAKAARIGDMKSAVATYNANLLPAQTRQKAAVAALLRVQKSVLANDAQAAETSISSNRWVTAILLAFACSFGIGALFVVRHTNAMLLSSVVELAESTVQIAAAAGQVAATSQSMAQGASEQAATIQETSSASAEIHSMARRNTDNSRTTADIVTASQDNFQDANHSLNQMIDAMQDINSSSQKISKIIKVIDEIAFQTNILALNAAVEAARAGEAGMGFAVVADEVRNLAQRCAQAAKDTADLIEESINKSDGGRVKVDQVAVAIRAITTESSKIRVLVDEINLGSVEQSRGIDQISKAITQMEQTTQSSAASAEQGAAAAQQLNAQAETMKVVVNRLRAMIDGQSDDERRSAKTLPRSNTALSFSVVPKTTKAAASSFMPAASSEPIQILPPPQSSKLVSTNRDFPMDDDFKEF